MDAGLSACAKVPIAAHDSPASKDYYRSEGFQVTISRHRRLDASSQQVIA